MKDVSYLRIEVYSEHPEVRAMADLVINSHLSTQTRKHPNKYQQPARKLIASLWLRDTDLFRFGTTLGYFGEKRRKQVWMTPPVLTLFQHMVAIGLINEVIPAIPRGLVTPASVHDIVSSCTCTSPGQIQWIFYIWQGGQATTSNLICLNITADKGLGRAIVKSSVRQAVKRLSVLACQLLPLRLQI